MAKNDNLKDFLTDIADAIREKKGTTDLINPQDFSSEIANLEVGGGSEYDAVMVDGMFIRDYPNATIPYTIDTSKMTSMHSMFSYSDVNSSKLTTIPLLDTSNVTNMQNMFGNCSVLKSIPLLDTSKVTNMNSMFRSCLNLTTIPQLDTSNVTNMSSMFNGCDSLTTIPLLDTSNVTSMQNMFRCLGWLTRRLTTIPQLDTSNVTNMDSMFYGRDSLTSIPPLDTSKVTNMQNMFYGCGSLTTIPQLDMSSVTNVASIFSGCSLLYFVVIKNLGKGPLGGKSVYDFKGATNWGTGSDENRQSLIDSLITYSYDRASNGMAVVYILLSANTKALLTEEEIAQITAKGFTIS